MLSVHDVELKLAREETAKTLRGRHDGAATTIDSRVVNKTKDSIIATKERTLNR